MISRKSKYIHNSPFNQILNIKYSKKRERVFFSPNGKPRGLWYSIGYHWHEWLEQNMKDCLKEYDIHITFDRSKILIIDSLDKALEFHKKYVVDVRDQELKDIGFREINWKRVAKDYKGIEITDPLGFKWAFFAIRDRTFFKCGFEQMYMDTWDVPSGCIWDLSIINYYEVKKTKGYIR